GEEPDLRLLLFALDGHEREARRQAARRRLRRRRLAQLFLRRLQALRVQDDRAERGALNELAALGLVFEPAQVEGRADVDEGHELQRPDDRDAVLEVEQQLRVAAQKRRKLRDVERLLVDQEGGEDAR